MKGAEREYVIMVKGLSNGRHNLSFRVDKELFAGFGNTQILDASIVAELSLLKAAELIEIECNITGNLVTECDRCLEELTLPVETNAKLIVKFDRRESGIESDEIIVLDPAESELDISQFLYDYICLSLPIKRVHKDGNCNPDMISRLEGPDPEPAQNGVNSPFDSLNEMIKN
ncbi:MAG: DUF177 domain-containing protein [Bacteroidales bacterium]|nr:DUF177 domain-containing protein [Bacteroidales bacterium]